MSDIAYSMTGDRHRCYRNGKGECVLTNKHPATDECRKPRREGKFRGGKSGPERARAQQEKQKENGDEANTSTGAYKLVAPVWPPPPATATAGDAHISNAVGKRARN